MRFFRRRETDPDPIWRGVYASFAEVAASAEGHASQSWADALIAEMEAVQRGAWTDDFAAEHEQLVLLIAAKNGARILDFGGGVGQTYAYLRRVLPRVRIEYELVELPAVLELARRFHGDEVTLRADLEKTSADIVFVKSALQYVDDHRDVLRRLFAIGARFVVLEKFSGVAAPSYVTAQRNVSATPIPYRFISFDDVFAAARDAGYNRLVWRRLPRVYDQREFPPELRMGQASTLVFGKRD
ncbi:MAG TPA: methyltransferase, TIGR04325 family [Thermoanaerobaculia bacterium]|nr:methyltransferase, TIGR04325 family [Thermoanaerobaculia bacterium]